MGDKDTVNEIRLFWDAYTAEIQESGSHCAATYLMRLITGQRSAEVMGMRYDEIGADRIWTIPGSRCESGREHRVWLSDAAMQIVEEASRRNSKRTVRQRGKSPF
jgi:integrase